MVPRPCKICSSLGCKTEISTKFSTLDEQQAHSQVHLFQLGYISETNGDRVPLKEIFAKCFPSEDFEKPDEVIGDAEEMEKSRSTLLEISKRIMTEKANESNSIECQVCRSNVRYTIGSFQTASLILRHACFHSTKKPFVCRQECQQHTSSKSDMVRHVKRIHKIDSPIDGVHFDADWAECFDEIKESLTKCFVRMNPDGASPKIRTPPSELLTQRRSVLLNILKNAKGAKKIRCNQCRQEIRAAECRNLEQHLYTHLHRRIYECAKCDRWWTYKSGIVTHLTKDHGVTSNGNYIDHSDERHEEIMELMKKCFGEEGSKRVKMKFRKRLGDWEVVNDI